MSRPSVKIVHVIDDLGLGGAQRQLVELLSGLDRRRFDVSVIALSDAKVAYADAIRQLGIPLTLIPHAGAWSWATLTRLTQTLRSLRPRIVQTWLFTADLYGRLAAMRGGAERIISTVRSVEPDKPWQYVLVDRVLRRWTHRFIVNAEAVGRMLAVREGVPRDRIELIYNGVDLERWHPAHEDGVVRRALGLLGEHPLIGIVGRLAPVKDHETFLRAAALVVREVPKAQCVIIGDGPLRRALEELCCGLQLESRVHFLGAQARMEQVYAALDVIVVSSRYEGCSNVILEAMAMGKPVIATAVGGNPELLTPRTGMLVPPGDAQRLAQAIITLLRDAAGARAWGAAARRDAEARFSLARMIEATQRCYESLLSTDAQS